MMCLQAVIRLTHKFFVRPSRILNESLSYIWMFKNWPTFFGYELGLIEPGSEILYEFRSGPRVVLDRNKFDNWIVHELLRQRIYEPTPDFRLRNGWTVLDLGAHKGVFSVDAARSGPDTRVVAVEPEPHNFELLLKNLELNELTNVKALNYAVWTTAGPTPFFLADSWNHSLLCSNDEGESRQMEVDSVTLSELIHCVGGTVDLLKMDIEGAEHSVLLEAQDKVLRHVHRIALEYHTVQSRSSDLVCQDIRQHLESLGYRCFATPDHLLFAVSRNVSDSSVAADWP
jgi:FkbM family methyltransferase